LIHSGVHIGTNSKLFQRSSSAFHIFDPYKYCAELDKVIQNAYSRGLSIPDKFTLRVINTTINELVSAGIYYKYDLLYFFGFNRPDPYIREKQSYTDQDEFYPIGEKKRSIMEGFSLINYINPSKYYITLTKGSTRLNIPFLTEKGWVNNLSGIDTGILNTNWTHGVDNINWTQNDAGVMCFSNSYLSIQSNATYIFGVSDTTITRTTCRLLPSVADGRVLGIINGNNTNQTYVAAGGTTNSYGHHRLQRTASNASAYLKNGVQLGTSTGVSQATTGSYPVCIGGLSNNGTRSGTSTNAIPYFGLGKLCNSIIRFDNNPNSGSLSSTPSLFH